LKKGIPTNAKIVSIAQTDLKVGKAGNLPKRIYAIDLMIKRNGEAGRVASFRRAFNSSEKIPTEGDEMIILIDPRNTKNVMLSPNQ